MFTFILAQLWSREMQQETVVLLGMVAFGLMHGVNPSHGWTVAVLYSIRGRSPLLSSITSSSIIVK